MFARRNTTVRPAAVAGAFYPRARDELQSVVSDLLSGARAAPQKDIRAVIAPHAGYMYSGAVAAEAFAPLKPLKGYIRRAVVIGPAHFVAFRGIAAPSHAAFATPLGDMAVDRDALGEIAELPQVVAVDEPHTPEHALEVELPFLYSVLGEVPIIPLVVGSAKAEEVADVLARLWNDGTLIVVSTDLSHYHSYETARGLDAATAQAIERCDEEGISAQDACGALPLRGLLIEVKRRGLTIERLDLRNSGDTSGGRDSVVGYGAWAVRDTVAEDKLPSAA